MPKLGLLDLTGNQLSAPVLSRLRTLYPKAKLVPLVAPLAVVDPEEEHRVLAVALQCENYADVKVLSQVSYPLPEPEQQIVLSNIDYSIEGIDLWASYHFRNLDRTTLDPARFGRVPLSATQERDLASDLPWDGSFEFYRPYPDSHGILQVSRVGFNRDGTRALVGVLRSAGDSNAEGALVFLSKREGQWVVDEVRILFVT